MEGRDKLIYKIKVRSLITYTVENIFEGNWHHHQPLTPLTWKSEICNNDDDKRIKN